mgnify:FL=1
MADDRVEVKRGDSVIMVVASQVEHWESLGYEQVAKSAKRTPRKRASKAGE